jgi:hypothetical protein
MLEISSKNLPQKAHGTLVLNSVFHTLAYADVFDYPLTADEVYRYLPSATDSFEDVTQTLADETLFSKTEDYYTLRGRERIVETRQRRAKVARRLWPKAVRYGWMIAYLPFVRMVAVTGSLAMNNADEGKDIDFMIVTAPGHLWTCRALILLVARFAKLEGIDICPNYLVTTNALELQERSLYVAHELTQMIPLSGMETYAEMRRLNGWIADYLPKALIAPEMPSGAERLQRRSGIQRALETVFRLPPANWFERWEMDRKIARLRHEQAASSESYFSAEVCKGHIDKHRQKTESAIQEKLKQVALQNTG